MSPNPQKILIVNDDGVTHPYFHATILAAECLFPNAEIIAASTRASLSGLGSSLSYHTGLSIKKEPLLIRNGKADHHFDAYVLEPPATPIDALIAGLTKANNIDLVIAGTNAGYNTADYADHSGTIAIARTAIRQGVPNAIAIAAHHEWVARDYLTLMTSLIAGHLQDVMDDWPCNGSTPLPALSLTIPNSGDYRPRHAYPQTSQASKFYLISQPASWNREMDWICQRQPEEIAATQTGTELDLLVSQNQATLSEIYVGSLIRPLPSIPI